MFAKMRRQKLLSFTLMLLTLSAGIVIGSFISSYGVKAARDNPQAPGATPLVIPNPVELSTTFSQIAKQVEPSVVNISTTYNPKPSSTSRNLRRRQGNPPGGDEDQIFGTGQRASGASAAKTLAGFRILAQERQAAIPFRHLRALGRVLLGDDELGILIAEGHPEALKQVHQEDLFEKLHHKNLPIHLAQHDIQCSNHRHNIGH